MALPVPILFYRICGLRFIGHLFGCTTSSFRDTSTSWWGMMYVFLLAELIFILHRQCPRPEEPLSSIQMK